MRKVISFVKEHPQKVFAAVGIGFILIAAFVFYREWDSISRVLTQADLGLLTIAGLLTVASYSLFMIGFVYVHRLFDVELPIARLALIGYVSATINHLLPLASAGEYSLRVYALKQHGYTAKDSVTVSLVHSFMHNLLLFVLFPLFALYVLTGYAVGTTASIVVVLSAIVSLVVLTVATATIFHQKSRGKVIGALARVSIAANLDIADDVHLLSDHLENAKSTMQEKVPLFAVMLVLVTVEWFTSALILDYCFRAIGYDMPLPQLFVGFILGISMGLFSLLPGGIGIQEGTMTLAFVALGVPFEYAFLAPILFRALYYFLPAAVSLVLYWLLLKGDGPEESVNLLGNDNES